MFSKPSYTLRCLINPGGSPGLYHLVAVCLSLSLCRGSPVKSGRNVQKSKFRDWCVGNVKIIGAEECCGGARVQFRKQDDVSGKYD